ncbi:MAG: TatD family hydrolase [Candidatus Limimorpha sp.]
MIINTHSHIYDEAFDNDREEVFKRGLDSGVDILLLPNTDELSIRPMMDFYRRHSENTRIMIGLHPESVREDYIRHLGVIEKNIDTLSGERDDKGPIMTAIGEIGLDLYWDKTFEREQVEVLREQLRWAKELGLPVSLHTREAFPQMFKLLEHEQDGRLAGVMHCFNGTLDEARTAISLGFALGLGGVITYKNCHVRDFLNEIPLENIVFETDDPYLPPIPFRGRRNEPAYIVKTIELVAQTYNIETKELIQISNNNAENIFRLT